MQKVLFTAMEDAPVQAMVAIRDALYGGIRLLNRNRANCRPARCRVETAILAFGLDHGPVRTCPPALADTVRPLSSARKN